jgi:hypothetical protein
MAQCMALASSRVHCQKPVIHAIALQARSRVPQRWRTIPGPPKLLALSRAVVRATGIDTTLHARRM